MPQYIDCARIYHGVVTLPEIFTQMILSHQVFSVALLLDGLDGQTSKQCPVQSKCQDFEKTNAFACEK